MFHFLQIQKINVKGLACYLKMWFLGNINDFLSLIYLPLVKGTGVGGRRGLHFVPLNCFVLFENYYVCVLPIILIIKIKASVYTQSNLQYLANPTYLF